MKQRVVRRHLGIDYFAILTKLRRRATPKRRAEAREGGLYRLEHDGRLIRVMEGLGCANGMGFSPDHKHMYLTDSSKRLIYVFDYDEAAGRIENRRVFKHTADEEGVPDGLTVDASGFVWSARWNGSCLVRYAPDGSENLRVRFPVKKVTSVTFGGEDYTDIYITTAGGMNRDKEGLGAGAIFHLNLGIQGVPEFASQIRLSTQSPSSGNVAE